MSLLPSSLVKDFPTLVQEQVTAVQAVNGKFTFSVGDPFLAALESNGALQIWNQARGEYILAIQRASSCKRNDLDTWVGQFGLTRNPGIAASGPVNTFRLTVPSQQSVVQVGDNFQTATGSPVFTVIIDTTNPNYNAALNGYILTPSTASITVPVQCTVVGEIGNVAINTITVISSAIAGVDGVNNSVAFTNGVDVESDDALRARFILFLQSLIRATRGALAFAIQSVQPNLNYELVENEDIDANPDPGFFYAVIDDGTGNPSPALLLAVSNALELYRGFTIEYSVYPPTIVTADVSAILTLTPTAVSGDVITAVTAALQQYINTLNIGVTLSYTKLAEIIYLASPDILNVTSLLLNASTVDIVPTSLEVVKSGTINLTVL